MPAREAERAARAAARHLSASAEFERCSSLLLYASLPDELPTGPLAELGREAGKRLYWPRLSGPDGLEFAASEGPDLVPGRYGVLAPPDSTPGRAAGAGDLVLVPGVAFDATGRRLGRGGGHYDRALARAEGAFRVGVGYEFQRIPVVPAEAHDQRLDALLTEAGLRRSEPG